MRRLQAAQEDEEDVNVTPLLDIVFIMLIFFIVTSTFIKEPGIDPLRPEASTQEKQRLVAVLVAVSEDNEIWIDGDKVELSEVKYRVEELRRESPKGNAVLQADAGARSELTLDVLQQIKDAGIADVVVSTTEG
ncbi:MAG: biopolymer transporter ExbD [Pseudomonadota bacterium]